MVVSKVVRIKNMLFTSILLLPSVYAYTYSVFDTLETPKAWSKNHRVEAGTVFPVKIALTERNLDKAEDFIMDVSDPISPNYGKFWTVDQVYETFAPSEETISAVRDWLVAEGIDPHRITQSESKGWLYFDSHATEAETLFHAEYHHFSHELGHESIASETYSIPDSLTDHIDFVSPGAMLTTTTKTKPEPFTKRKKMPPLKFRDCKDRNLTCCNFLIHPGCIRELYKLPAQPANPTVAPLPGNALGIYESNSVDPQRDLNLFFRRYAPFIPQNTAPKQVFFKGLSPPIHQPSGETALDLDCAYPIVYPQIIKTLQSLDQPEFLFSKTIKPPNVISTSFFEGFENGPKTLKVFARSCNAYMKTSLLGTSLIISSGDEGVSSAFGDPTGNAKDPFTGQIPAVCPFVTSVGATEVAFDRTVFQPERAVKKTFTGGGGFSQLFARPAYQRAAVAEYFANHDPGISFYNGTSQYPGIGKNLPKYNRLGRGFPDVSANGQNIITAFQGRYAESGGTSASAPIFASAMNLIVEQRLKAGKGPLGFLNPALYRNPAMLNDITIGFNSGNGFAKAFVCVPGWDPVTGLGTPNFPKMLEYFMSLP